MLPGIIKTIRIPSFSKKVPRYRFSTLNPFVRYSLKIKIVEHNNAFALNASCCIPAQRANKGNKGAWAYSVPLDRKTKGHSTDALKLERHVKYAKAYGIQIIAFLIDNS